MASQLSEVLEYMRVSPITSKQAIEFFGCTRLSDVIYVLKKRGFKIRTELVHHVNRYGNKGQHARYHLLNPKRGMKK